MKLPAHPGLRHLARRIVSRSRDVASTMSYELVSLAALAVVFPLTIRGLGPERYGTYVVLYLLFGLVGLWVHSGASAAVIQLILQLERQPAELLRIARRQQRLAALPLGAIGTVVAVVLLGVDVLVPAVMVLFVDLLLTGSAALNLATVFAVDGVVRSTNVRMVQPIVRAAGVAALAATSAISLPALVTVNVVASGTLWAVSGLALRWSPRMGRAGAAPQERELVRYTGLYATSMSTNAVQNEGEKFILESTRPTAEVGEYAAAYRVVSMALVPLGAVATAAVHWFMPRDDRAGGQLARTNRLAVPVALYGVVVAVVIVLGDDVVAWVVGDQFEEAALIATWLCLLPLLHGLADLPPMGLLGLGRNRERMYMGCVTSAVAIVLYLALTPTLGWRGAVLGTYGSELACIVVGWVLLVRYQRAADRAGAADAVRPG